MNQIPFQPSLVVLATALASGTVNAATAPVADTLTVTATRQDLTSSEIPRAVTVLDRNTVELQFQTARNLGDLLAKTVPGMAPASQTLTNFNQSLRGRNVLVLIDGVPQNTNRNVSRDLMNIDVSNIDRIEVVRGGSAIYGSGAAGGIIHITTRANAEQNQTTVGLSSSLTGLDGDAIGNRIEHQLSGGDTQFDYGLNLAWEQQRGFYDADGDRIAPEPSQGDLSDTDSLSVAGKLRWFFDNSTLTLSANHYDAEQDTDYGSDPSVASLPAGNVAALAASGLQLDEQNRTRNSMINLAWAIEETALGAIDTQLYYRDYHARFTPFDGRPYSTWNSIAQSYLDSETWGGRLTINTELSERSMLRWGADYQLEDSEMPVTTYDGDAFDNSNGLVFVDSGDRTFMPPIEQQSLGLFAQLEMELTEQLRWELGSRYERVDASFNDFVTLGQSNNIAGGKVDFDDLLFNTGVVYALNNDTEVYANFSQGFELPDIGLRLRYAPAGFDVSDSQLEPLKTDNYEVGLRSNWGATQATAAVFYSTSDLGQTTIQNMALALPRSEERIYGVELTLDHQLNDQWQLGGLLTWMEGERFDSNDQRWEALNGYRIPPVQLRAYAQYQPSAGWLHRLQLNYSGNRDDAFNDQVGFGSREVEAYTTVDYLGRYNLGKGVVSVGIENLFNEDYYSVYSQLLRNGNNTSHIAASGTTLKLSYSHPW